VPARPAASAGVTALYRQSARAAPKAREQMQQRRLRSCPRCSFPAVPASPGADRCWWPECTQRCAPCTNGWRSSAVLACARRHGQAPLRRQELCGKLCPFKERILTQPHPPRATPGHWICTRACGSPGGPDAKNTPRPKLRTAGNQHPLCVVGRGWRARCGVCLALLAARRARRGGGRRARPRPVACSGGDGTPRARGRCARRRHA